jgi:hypothetical protein
MPYTKQTWEDAPSTDTPISAARLGVIEEGIETATEIAEAAQVDADAGVAASAAAATAAANAQTTANAAGTAAATAQATANTKAAKADVQIVVAHGTDPNVARPSGYASVRWVGTATPANKLEGDDWVNPDAPLVATVSDTDALDVRLTAAEALGATNASGLVSHQTAIEGLEDDVNERLIVIGESANGGTLFLTGATLPDPLPVNAIIMVPAGTPAGDTTAPNMVGDLTVENGNGQVLLSWPAATDNVAVSRYRIYINTIVTQFENGPEAGVNVVVSGLTNGTTYTFGVAAEDAAGNIANPITALGTPAATPDTTPPAVPTGLTLTPQNTAFDALWVDPADADLATIGVYVWITGETEPTVPTVEVAAGEESWPFEGFENGVELSVKIDAKDTSGNRSAKTSVQTVTPAGAGGGGFEDITYVDSAVGDQASTSGTGVGVLVSDITGLMDGDTLTAHVSNAVSGGAGFITPEGWTAVPNSEVTGVNNSRFKAFTKVASGESGTWTFPWASGTGRGAAVVRAYRSSDGAIDVSASTADVTSDTTAQAPGVTTTMNKCRLVVGWMTTISNVVTAVPGSMGNLVQSAGGSGRRPVAVADETIAVAGATGGRDATLSGSTNSGGITLALRPAAS